MEILDDTIERYRKIFGCEPQILVSAPARVNLIGEHTDYNEGYVLPAAINRMIIIVAGPRNNNTLHLHSIDFQTSGTVSLDSLSYNPQALWMNYVIGVASVLQNSGLKLHVMNLCIRGNIPIGSGLSSSAALETASAIVFNNIHGFSQNPAEFVKVAHRAETEFVGVQCGIMDQFVLMFGRSKNAIFLSVSALHSNNLDLFGRIMVQWHESLRDDYEVSCDELNTFVDIAINTRGVFGARMTGAGFGGSEICFVAENVIDDLVERIRSGYPRRADRIKTFYIAETKDGTSTMNILDGTAFVPAKMLQ